MFDVHFVRQKVRASTAHLEDALRCCYWRWSVRIWCRERLVMNAEELHMPFELA